MAATARSHRQAILFDTPILAFHPSHGAPLDMVFYYGKQFPKSYRGGAFVARHGGQGPDLAEGHNGYDVIFVPFAGNGKPGTPVEFAQGFAGPTPASKNIDKATYRPVGAAVGPDGSLYIADLAEGSHLAHHLRRQVSMAPTGF